MKIGTKTGTKTGSEIHQTLADADASGGISYGDFNRNGPSDAAGLLQRGDRDAGDGLVFYGSLGGLCDGSGRFDTYTHWSLFGQIVLLLLIQVGGLGFMTILLSAHTFSGQKIGLSSRILMREAVAAPQVGGIVRMTRVHPEGDASDRGPGGGGPGSLFLPRLGLFKGLYYSVFHSVSAFCNAGFDLMGAETPFSSLTAEAGNWYLNLVIMALIVIGGLGFFVWLDLLDSRFRFKNLTLHSKIVVFMTAVLLGPAEHWAVPSGAYRGGL